ncbi:MAG: HypC/HybG/HupF family hydrogenase formation chaperone [Sulfuricella sp.]|nr:HypC/HybG/HupF family hydrogenase formation chaperone [Sulfuricella sp.]
MCMAIPSRVIALGELVATVECFGQTRDVNLMLMTEELALGDYVLVKAGNFAFEKVDEERALETLALMTDILQQPDMPMYAL